MRQPDKILIAGLLILTGFLSACRNNSDQETNSDADIRIDTNTTFIRLPDATELLPGWRTNNVVVNHVPGPPDNLHPTNGRLATRSWVLSMTQCYLMRLDPMQMKVVPDLADGEPEVSDDGLSFTYRIREAATWDDGTPITANDAAFTLKTAKCPLTNNPSTKSYLDNLADVVIDPADPGTCTMVMKEPYVQNIAFLASFVIMQEAFHDPDRIMRSVSFSQMDDTSFTRNMPEEVVDFIREFNDGKYGNDLALLNGAGPYKVTSWDRGATLVLERKSNHWTFGRDDLQPFESANPEKIIFKEIKDDNAAILELKAQEMDASVWLSTQSMQQLESDSNFLSNYNYRYIDNFSFNYLGVNMRPDGITHARLFDDKTVRKAMTRLIPIERIIDVIYNGKATRWTSFHAPAKPGYNDSLQPYSYDLQAGIALLEQAGWTDTDGDNIRDKMIDGKKVDFSFEFMYSSSGAFIDQMVEMIVEALYEAGIKAEPAPMELSVLARRVTSKDFDAYLGAWATNSLPDDFTQLWHSTSYTEGSNFVGFGNSRSDALIEELRTTIDTDKRIPLIKELQAMVHEEAPYVMLFSADRKNVIHKRFGNQVMTFEKPGNMLNYLMLLSAEGMQELQ